MNAEQILVQSFDINELPPNIAQDVREYQRGNVDAEQGNVLRLATIIHYYLEWNGILGVSWRHAVQSFIVAAVQRALILTTSMPASSNVRCLRDITADDVKGVKEWCVHGHSSKNATTMLGFLERTYKHRLKTEAVRAEFADESYRAVVVYVGKPERAHVTYDVSYAKDNSIGALHLR